MKRSIFSLLFIFLYCEATSFVLRKKRTKLPSKSDLIELMSEVVTQKSSLIEREAQLQQGLFKQIRAALDSKLSAKQIAQLEKVLKEELQRTSIYCQSQKQLFSLLS